MSEKSQYPQKGWGVFWSLLCMAMTGLLLLGMLFFVGKPVESAHPRELDVAIMDKYDMVMTNRISDALSGIVTIEKEYWLSDEDLIAPEPDPEKYGETDDPATLQWLMEEAAVLLDGQPTMFTTETEILEGTKVKYYLDDTIFAVTWKQGVDLAVFTCSEVKIAHPSQFRRFMAGGSYGTGIRYTTTDMAKNVNAVTASNGDYYDYRPQGIVVNNGTVYRSGTHQLDTCFIDDQGDLVFMPNGALSTKEEVETYVRENNVRFSLAFGPVLIENGENKVPKRYVIGEIAKNNSRAALCQLGQCHYMVVTANIGLNYYQPPTLKDFADQLIDMGVTRAYTLDGGQTATIVMGDELINSVDYGGERKISDIIYFATAIPDGA